MKTIFTCIMIFLGLIAADAQRVKYKDVYELIKTRKHKEAYPLLKIVLKADTANASANLYLGSFLYHRAKAYDVLKENDAALIDCDSAIFYLSRAKRLINEKEIRKNDDYYTGYADKNKKDTNKVVINRDSILRRVTHDVNHKLKDIAIHRGEIHHIFKLFNKSVSLYDKSATIYKTINVKYSSVKEMCLLSDDALHNDLAAIQHAYDSSHHYFELYQKAIKHYPIHHYNQHLEVENIETFRLDGLSKAEFLSNKPKVWNYSKWSKDIIHALEKDIRYIRAAILRYDEMYNTYSEKLSIGKLPYDSATAVVPDKKLYSLANKYDYNSMALKILDYKQKKLEYEAGQASPYHSAENTTGANFEAKLEFFYNQTKKIAVCDSFLQKLSKINFSKEAPKYSFYVNKRFADVQGLNTYVSREKVFVESQKEASAQKYTNLMYDFYMKYSDTAKYVPFAGYQIALFPGYEFCKTSVKTTVIKEDKKGNVFVAGYINASNGVSNAFVCKMSDNYQVVWFKNIAIKPENKATLGEFITAIEPLDEGCIVGVNSRLSTGIKNFLIKFDKNGTEVFNRKVESGAVARQLIFDEINDNFILVTKGELAFDYTDKEEALTIVCYDNTGMAKWTHKFNLNGSVVEYGKIFEGYLLLCNFTSISTGSSVIQSKAGSYINLTNVFMLKISTSGQVVKYETLASEKPIYALGIAKVSNSNINILGVNSDFLNQWHFLKPMRENDRNVKVINSNVEMLK